MPPIGAASVPPKRVIKKEFQLYLSAAIRLMAFLAPLHLKATAT
jgi:hypothetical protein